MSIIRQGSLFDIQDLYDLEPSKRFESIFSTLTIEPVLAVVSKKSIYGAPTELNYPAMVYALVARIVERIPTIKDLVKRLKQDYLFRLDCGFLFSDKTPSEASFSRLTAKISQTNALESVQHTLLRQAMEEGFLCDDVVAIDATHVESRDRATKQEKKPKPEPKKRGRKTKEEQAKYEQEMQENEAAQTLYEKKVEAQLGVPLGKLREEVPTEPDWGIKKNSEGKNVFWFGFKLHLAVGTASQYVMQSLMSSGSLNDGKAAIPLLKGIASFPLSISFSTLDAGYDLKPIYKQIQSMNAQGIIAYNRRNEGENLGVDEHFAPTCVREHSYRYDSYDKEHRTLKYVRPKECQNCPLGHDSLCQKVYKIKQDTDLRKYTAPARGSTKWKKLFAKRTAVERVFAYLKEFFQLNNVRYRSGKRAKLHMDLVTIVYNSMKLASDQMQAIKKQAA